MMSSNKESDKENLTEAEKLEESFETKPEGSVKKYYGKRYERDPKNRKKAIELHGTTCAVCGFDFEKVYGERGKGFIEVHHTEPLGSLSEEKIINPQTDLVPVCSNCHRIIHRPIGFSLVAKSPKRVQGVDSEVP